jgi:predicted signal transduction protein with EAL and GGDEF domain
MAGASSRGLRQRRGCAARPPFGHRTARDELRRRRSLPGGAGALFVLDEFGRSLCGLDQLRKLPIAAVKLDATLVQG